MRLSKNCQPQVSGTYSFRLEPSCWIKITGSECERNKSATALIRSTTPIDDFRYSASENDSFCISIIKRAFPVMTMLRFQQLYLVVNIAFFLLPAASRSVQVTNQETGWVFRSGCWLL